MVTGDPKKHGTLVHLIFKMDPFTPPKKSSSSSSSPPSSPTSASKSSSSDVDLWSSLSVADAHLKLCLNLVSSNSTFLLPHLNALVRLITLHSTSPTPTTTTPCVNMLHASLLTTLTLVPKGSTLLPPILASNFPYIRSSTATLARYASTLLRIHSYFPASQSVQLILRKCVEVDVEIRVNTDGSATVEKPEMSDDAALVDERGERTGEAVKAEEEGRKLAKIPQPQVHDRADALDALMSLLFAHIDAHLPLEAGPWQSVEACWEELWGTFEATILQTHKSKVRTRPRPRVLS